MGNAASARQRADPPKAAEAVRGARRVVRLVRRGELAAPCIGLDVRDDGAPEQCPICLMAFPALNTTRCCAARLCTQCYATLRPTRTVRPPCPFCKHRRLEAVFCGARAESDLSRERDDERRASAAASRDAALPLSRPPTLRQEEECDDGGSEGETACQNTTRVSETYSDLVDSEHSRPRPRSLFFVRLGSSREAVHEIQESDSMMFARQLNEAIRRSLIEK